MAKKIKITATTAEEFKKCQDLFDSFPEDIQEQITAANFGFCYITFQMNVKWGDPYHSLFLPCDPYKLEWLKEGIRVIYRSCIIEVEHKIENRNVSIQFLKNDQ